jgi:hypothetical protein
LNLSTAKKKKENYEARHGGTWYNLYTREDEAGGS